ncbi:MAG TPA: twin-arginine translocase subunit TatB [Gammaproteobacteria bacterium]|nr:twin-arginine translocase subunit TatB [Gammaproteobacteria bacterium]
MFDIGFWEILLILVLALVVIGPERLPGAARQAGFFVGKARRYIEGVRSEVESELDVSEFKRMLHNQEVQINELQQQIKSGVDDLKPDVSASDILTDTPSHSFYDEPTDDGDEIAEDEKEPSSSK